jgi:Tol biopolymer transport system component
MRRSWLLYLALLGIAGAGGLLLRRGSELPKGVTGALAFVSDREGVPALYWRRLPRDRERRLTFGSEAVAEPAISPDGTRVAFSMNGRIGVVAVASGERSILTLGIDWRDAQPAWLPDGRRLVVSARRRTGDPAGLQLLDLAPDGTVARHALTQPRAADDTSPAPNPDGGSVVFVRESHLMRVQLADGRVRLLTGGFKRDRSPRFLPSGRLVCAWSEGKRQGIDTLDADGRSRRTLVEGGRFYRSLAPSPDGRFLVGTLGYDLGFHPLAALLGARREELFLLDADGRDQGVIEGSFRYANHSADWSR